MPSAFNHSSADNTSPLLPFITKLPFIVLILVNVNGCFDTDKVPSNAAGRSSRFTIKGVSMVAPVNPIDETALNPILNVHANSIALMPYAFFNPGNPVIKYNKKGQWWGESDEGVIACIQLAHQQKLSVMLKPHLWISHGAYTGAFTLNAEADWQLWENSYTAYILHFASIADSLKAELFCLGTELGASIQARPQYWSTLIDTLRKVYHGKLTYAANWDDYSRVPFWEKLDYIGVDAYFPLAADKTPEVNTIKKGWVKYMKELEQVSRQYNKPILFTEYGYRNVDNTTAEPWKENDGEQNDEAQANALEAFFESFAGKSWFAGGYVWKWYVDESRSGRQKIDFTPQNKPAEKVIAAWYK